jgi:hypothetical protein
LQELQLQATLYSTDETSDSEASVELEQWARAHNSIT